MVAISVVMPVHNGGGFLHEAVESILHQSFVDFELLIVDDCSTDETAAVLSSYDDPRMLIIRNEQQLGVSRSLNRALQRARARFVARMDADDVSEEDRLQEQLRFLRHHPHVIVCGTAGIRMDEIGQPHGTISRHTSDGQIRFALLTSNPFLHPSVVFQRDAVLRRGGYDARYSCAQDYDLWCRLASDGCFANLPEPFIRYRIHARTVSATKRDEQLRNHARRSVQHLMETGIAHSQEEARAFQFFSGLENCRVGPVPDGRLWVRYAEMVEAFFASLRRRSTDSIMDETDCRVRLRRRFLRRAQQVGWLSRWGRRYLWLARRLDPEGMRIGRLGVRAVRHVLGKAFPSRAQRRPVPIQ